MEHNVGYLVKTRRAVSNLKFWVWLPQAPPTYTNIMFLLSDHGEPPRASIEISPRRSYYKKRLSLFCGRSCHWRWHPGWNVTMLTLQWHSPTKYSPATLSLPPPLSSWTHNLTSIWRVCGFLGGNIWLPGNSQPGSNIVFTWFQPDKLEAGMWSLWNFFKASVLKSLNKLLDSWT